MVFFGYLFLFSIHSCLVLFLFYFLFPYQWFQGCIVSVNVTGVSWLVIFFFLFFFPIVMLVVPCYIILHIPTILQSKC